MGLPGDHPSLGRGLALPPVLCQSEDWSALPQCSSHPLLVHFPSPTALGCPASASLPVSHCPSPRPVSVSPSPLVSVHPSITFPLLGLPARWPAIVSCKLKVHLYTHTHIHTRMRAQPTYRNRSWPAVSQICSFTVFPPTLTTRDPNSTPIVWFESCLTESGREIGGNAVGPHSPDPRSRSTKPFSLLGAFPVASPAFPGTLLETHTYSQ